MRDWWRLALLSPLGLLKPSEALTRGVNPAEAPRYHGDTFACAEGATELPASSINDDFCDCEDGSDEPGTAACAGRPGADERWFYCPNSAGTPRYVYSSRVGDGICDCCDGSDEWQLPGTCQDLCEEQGRARKARLEQRRAEMERGIRKRQAALADAEAEVKEWTGKLAVLEAEEAELLKSLQARQEIRRQKRAAVVKEARRVAVSRAAALATAQETPPLKGQGGQAQVTPSRWGILGLGPSLLPAPWAWNAWNLQVCSDKVCIARAAVARRELRQIKVKSGGALVDFVEFVYASGEASVVGEGKGEEQEPFDLEPGEVLVEIRGAQGGLLDRIQFVTSRGRESKAYGGSGGDSFSFKASDGKMIVGLRRAVGLAGRVTGMEEALFRPLTPAEKELEDAVGLVQEAERGLSAKAASMQELQGKIELAAGAHAAYQSLNECGTAQLGQYNYKICPFGEATQGHVRLGRWKGWASDARHVGLFDNGERCFSGIVRSLRVQFECGEKHVVETVREPSQCVYEATMTHPAACDPRDFEESDRVLQPHEGHVEL
ncbi:unnamed protein product [Symbiodinium microadriaticum]|nr:unnamed protein product [Symbiodinium microadriaticum]